MNIATIALLSSLSFSATAQSNATPKITSKPGAGNFKPETAKRVARDASGRMILEPMTAAQFRRSANAQAYPAPTIGGKPDADALKPQSAHRVARTAGGRMMLEPMTPDQFSRKK